MSEELLSYRMPKSGHRPRSLCLDHLVPITLVDVLDAQNDCTDTQDLSPLQDELIAFNIGDMAGVLARVRNLEDKIQNIDVAKKSVACISVETQKFVDESAKVARSDKDEGVQRV